MASVEDPEKQEKPADVSPAPSEVALGANDVAIIPKGALDPVYEAKARVLNRAVRLALHVLPFRAPLSAVRHLGQLKKGA